jgi:hypothetical protein
MLVEFNASVWTARKLDRTVTEEVIADKHAAARGAARVNKNLLAGRPELESISKFVAGVRNWVYANTLPWSDSGLRLLPVKQFMRFEQQMKDHAVEFDKLVGAFVTIYPSLITAQAMALGSMFNRDEYPSAGVIATKFAFNYNYLPVPDAGDLRVDVGNEAKAELQAKLQEIADQRVAAANKELWERLHGHLTRMQDRLKVDIKDGEEKPRRFHNTLVTGGVELCDLLDALNVTNDIELERMSKQLRSTLRGVDAEDLRDNLNLRAQTLAKVDAMIDKFSF